METANTLVWERIEFGHVFRIEKLATPKQIGATLRHFRLFDNGEPASGGQWHETQESAEHRADYVLQVSYIKRIEWLEHQVNTLTRELNAERRKTQVNPES